MSHIYKPSHFNLRMLYKTPEKIVSYDFLTLKPLGKSPNGHFVPTAVALGLENGLIKVYDIHSVDNTELF